MWVVSARDVFTPARRPTRDDRARRAAHQNVTFAFETNSQVEAMRSGDRPHFTYSPRGNPTVRCLELKIADLAGNGSIRCDETSGMAAISSAMLLADGGHLLASDRLYDLTKDFLHEDVAALEPVTFLDLSDADDSRRHYASHAVFIY